MMEIGSAELQNLVDRFIARRTPGGVTLRIESLTKPAFSWVASSGMSAESQYFIASSTKLYVAALTLKLVEQGLLRLDDRLVDRIDVDLSGLHGSPSYVQQMTIRHALSHTTGLANYLEDSSRGKPSLLDEVLQHGDQYWDLQRVLEHTQELPPRFAPGAQGKAHYSDTNYQLLGRIIELATGMSLSQAIHSMLVEPAGLSETYLFDSKTHNVDLIRPFNDGAEPVRLPLTMSSVGADGGMVSSAVDGAKFLRSLMGGEIISAQMLATAMDPQHRIFFPFRYGLGVMTFKLPRVLTGFRDLTMFGHGGATGSLLFVAPQHDAIVVGTVNQLQQRSMSYQLATKALHLWAKSRK
jgi:D-alanyl-D-alanine carboxypeptidase